MMNLKQIGTLLVWMAAGALVGALLAFVQEVPPSQIPFWAVMGVLIVLVGKMIQLISLDEQKAAAERRVQVKPKEKSDVPSSDASALSLPESRLSPDEAREWLDDLLVKQQEDDK